MTRTTAAALVLLGGCSLVDGIPEEVLVDTLCRTAQRKEWSAEDGADTIRDAKAWNQQVARQCGAPRKMASR